MPLTSEQRGRTSDRRRRPRGGRRVGDRPGYTPLVMVVDTDTGSRDTSEAILAKLHFAVAPMDSVEKALSVMAALKPEVIVAQASDAPRLRERVPQSRPGVVEPLLVVKDGPLEPDALVEEIRRVLRTRRVW